MEKRLQLQTTLEELLRSITDNINLGDVNSPWQDTQIPFGGYGKLNVYFQPPETVKLVYPCIIYSRSSGDTKFANNKPYINTKRYQLIVIDKNPDSIIPEVVTMLPMCKFERHYTKDNLNHDVFNIYY
jgi:hypothetical protein